MCDSSKGLQLQQNDHQQHVRIHHRFWDAQKHLLPTLVKLKIMNFDKSVISLKVQQTFISSHISISSTCDFSRGLQSQQNDHQLHVRIHHRFWDAQKHLLPTLVKLKIMNFDNSIISLTVQQNIFIISNIYSIDL